ncbi:hypothetical protein APY03_4664 [Variovorax sp. WDL1]|nr:hypothetical protein APY03_4664 [Variovorax sp. WDL1]
MRPESLRTRINRRQPGQCRQLGGRVTQQLATHLHTVRARFQRQPRTPQLPMPPHFGRAKRRQGNEDVHIDTSPSGNTDGRPPDLGQPGGELVMPGAN